MAPSAIKRQAMGLILGNPHWPTRLDDIDERLHNLDRRDGDLGQETVLSGPFGLFHTQQPRSDDRLFSLSRKEDTEMGAKIGASAGDPTLPACVLPVDLTEHCVESSARAPDSTVLSLVQSSSPAVVSKGVPRFEDLSEDHDVEYLPSRPELDLDLRGTSLAASSHLARVASRDTLINTLLHHYVHNVANVLQPIKHPRNTYSSIYATTAMAVAQRMPRQSLQQDLRVPNSKVALLYSLLTSSAFQLRGHDDDSEADFLARYCRNQAISHLQLALDSLSGSQHPSQQGKMVASAKREEVLSVMLTLVTADILDGQMSEFWIHVDGAEQITRWLHGRVLPGSRGEHLLNISSIHRIIAKSTDGSIQPMPWTETRDAYSMPNLFHGNGEGLEFTYGITATLADFIRRTTLLARNVSYYQSRSLSFPLGLQAACDELIRDIASWDISQEPLGSFSACDDITVLLASKHILAFAGSIRIYYYTRVIPCTRLEMASYVSVVAAHLSDIESIKKRTGYNAATIAWPGFIASCEAERADRGIWSAWWENMLEYRIGNIKTLWSVVRETWEFRDQGGQVTPAWMSVLKQKSKRILVL